jgi:ketosteroid isomerase-like protein
MSSETDVRKASDRFYSALNSLIKGDTGSMSDVWSHGAGVTSMHPNGGRQVGWDNVQDSFQQVAKLASAGQVKLEDQILEVKGDLAYELGVERGQATLAGQQVTFDHRVTNIYRQEGGTWKIVHHHTDISPSMLDLVKRLQPKK